MGILNLATNTLLLTLQQPASLGNGYYVYLDGIILPVTPKSITITINGKNETIELINEGEVNQIKTTGLTNITFDCLLPNAKYPFAYYPNLFRPAVYYLDKLNALKQKKKPFKFKVIRKIAKKHNYYNGYKTKFLVTLENYTITEDAEEYGLDVGVSIELKQYQNYGAEKLVLKEQKIINGKKRTTAIVKKDTRQKKEPSSYYIVKTGDCLNAIARKELEDSTRWKEIYELNKKAIEEEAKKRGKGSSSNGWWIFPGTKLKLPKE